jgi:hypothetical protein
MREEAIEPNRAPRAPLLMDGPEHSAILWAQILDAFDTSRLGDPSCREKVFQGRDGRSCDRARSCATCSSGMDGLDHFGEIVGPIPMLNMAQLHWPQISVDRRSAPSIDPRR